MKRRLTLLTLVLATFGLFAAAVDALIVTDEEFLLAIVDNMEGELSSAAIDDALVHVRTDEVPVTLNATGRSRRYESDDAALASDTQRRLRVLLGSEVEVLQRDVQIDGDSAQVRARMRLPQGPVSVSAQFEKRGSRWLLRSASVS